VARDYVRSTSDKALGYWTMSEQKRKTQIKREKREAVEKSNAFGRKPAPKRPFSETASARESASRRER
jgi:hypothetical protein